MLKGQPSPVSSLWLASSWKMRHLRMQQKATSGGRLHQFMGSGSWKYSKKLAQKCTRILLEYSFYNFDHSEKNPVSPSYSARLSHKGQISQNYVLFHVSRKRNNGNRNGFTSNLDLPKWKWFCIFLVSEKYYILQETWWNTIGCFSLDLITIITLALLQGKCTWEE